MDEILTYLMAANVQWSGESPKTADSQNDSWLTISCDFRYFCLLEIIFQSLDLLGHLSPD